MKEGQIKTLLDSLTQEQRELLVGRVSDDPLTKAYDRKRVVHPGVKARPYPPAERKAVWEDIMNQTAPSDEVRTAYIHVPFCSHKCLYCGFFQNFTNDEAETAYVDRLIQDLARDSEKPYMKSAPIRSVFLGGGTPSALSPHNIGRLLRAIRHYLPLANDCELTLEGRVSDMVEEKMDVWFSEGVNRISIGVQSFNTKIRQMAGRLDSRETIMERMKKAASYNQAAIIVDLIFGLPGQTVETLIQDLEDLDSLPIDGMDLYQLNLFENSLMKQAIDAGTIPPAATTVEQAQMYKKAGEWMRARMYKRISGCHWSRTARERSLYNTLTKCGAKVIPFGAGAGGFVADATCFLSRDIAKYQPLVDAGEKPFMVLMQKSPNDALHNEVKFQLEMGYFSPQKLADKFGIAKAEMETLADAFVESGLLVRGEVLYTMTEAGRFWQMNMTQSILECIEVLSGGTWSPEIEKIAAQG